MITTKQPMVRDLKKNYDLSCFIGPVSAIISKVSFCLFCLCSDIDEEDKTNLDYNNCKNTIFCFFLFLKIYQLYNN